MITILIILTIIVFFVLIFEIAKICTFGSLNSKISFDINDYYFFHTDTHMMFSKKTDNPYLSRISKSLLSKWHTNAYCIPHWSKFHKEIEAKYQQLLNQ